MSTTLAPFWNPSQPLSVPASALLTATLAAHASSARRENVSSQVLRATAFGSGRYETALAAALNTLGGIHAPLINTFIFLNHPDVTRRARELMSKGKRVPGWGSDFATDAPDPLWNEVAQLLNEHFRPLSDKIEHITRLLHADGKPIYPNPSCYTAACGLAIGIPRVILPWIFVQGRLGAWSALILETLHRPSTT